MFWAGSDQIIQVTLRHIGRQTNPRSTALLFLFHGSGDTGEHFKQWLDVLNEESLNFPHIKIVFPTAPRQPYTPNGGMKSYVWFNRTKICISDPDDKHSIDLICNKALELIHREVANGIPLNRIVVGGFSMGGALAMQLAYRFKKTLAGCLAMSSFLSQDSLVYQTLKREPSDTLPELLQFHGTADKLIPFEWGKKTFETLKECGVQGTLIPLNSVEHEIVKSEIMYFKDWLLKILPENYQEIKT